LQWLKANAELLTALGTAAMAMIWLVDLQLFYLIFRQQRRGSVVLQQSAGTDLHSECILVNMSAVHVDVACVLSPASC
jgi:hypothetical protein